MSESDSVDLEAEHSRATTDHETIKRWVEERGGSPAHVAATADGDDPGLLRLQFPDTQRDHGEIEPISWEQFFEKFDDENLAFVYQSETEGGRTSRFYKFVDRESLEE
ncbi:hypothetical protein [Halopiger goleimassiliensis]|uniref:hypothetical protein n=1 Tax=Halopiger goleimassiliensis TaxID=1293048 RepID=UPI000678007C|nr:hypothetical protein [Halopiger goleimassiliensis]